MSGTEGLACGYGELERGSAFWDTAHVGTCKQDGHKVLIDKEAVDVTCVFADVNSRYPKALCCIAQREEQHDDGVDHIILEQLQG